MQSTGRKIQAAFVCVAHVSRGQGPSMSAGAPTAPHSWQGGKNAKYVGPEACARCHQDEARTQHSTAMGRALEPVATSDILRANPDLTFKKGLQEQAHLQPRLDESRPVGPCEERQRLDRGGGADA